MVAVPVRPEQPDALRATCTNETDRPIWVMPAKPTPRKMESHTRNQVKMSHPTVSPMSATPGHATVDVVAGHNAAVSAGLADGEFKHEHGDGDEKDAQEMRDEPL
ncbi:hypothetical protein NQ176_g4061 [Zarea fungicola]|uniref:Uncharacterized protein n=1 Tax=Zarea fungicola TaxID=93591 RepID=A0ACC1NGM5_9HYPO|nr:hypothetical protein NQ176_g4061 [Lecanicillium fungicola]